MENYVNDLLKNADLTVVTKKHVRMKYKEHVGRELTPEEKSKINDMVYAFVKELSAAVQQESSPIVMPETSPSSKEESPGNKENKQSNQKPSKFIIKGHVVNKKDLYKPKSKEKNSASPEDKGNQPFKSKEKTLNKDLPQSSPTRKKRVTSTKLKIHDVMTAVLGPDAGDSSSEVSSVSSLTDTSLSESEPELGDNIHEALQKLKAEREKKIQMSQEKKIKFEKKEKGKQKSKARRSLPMQEPRLKDLKKSTKVIDDSDSISLISEDSSVDSEKMKERLLEKSVVEIDRDNNKALKTLVKDLSRQDTDSGELKLKKTPQDYVKCKPWVSEKNFLDGSEKKKKLVKRKRKKIEKESDSDSDSDSEVDEKQRHSVKQRKAKIPVSLKEDVIESESETDSEDETLDKIAARNFGDESTLKKSEDGRKRLNDLESKTGDKLSAKKKLSKKSKVIGTDSGTITGDTPLAKKKKDKSKRNSDSELGAGDAPLVKQKFKKSIVIDTDSETSTGSRNTHLAKKKSEKVKSNGARKKTDQGNVSIKKRKKYKDFDSNKEHTPSSEKQKIHKSESSTGDTPLAQIKKIKKSYVDSDESTGDTPLKKKQEKIRNKSENNDSDASTGDTPLKKKREKIRKKYENSDLDASTGDTPLIKKKKQKLKSSNESNSKVNQTRKQKVDEIKVPETSGATKKNDTPNDKNSLVVRQNSKETADNKATVKSANRKRKLSESSNVSTGDTPLVKKKKLKLDKTPTRENYSELSDVSTDETPLVRKKYKLRNEKSVVHTDDSKSFKEEKYIKKQLSETMEDVDNLEGSPHEANNCDITTETDTPLKTMKGRHNKSKILDSNSEAESPVKKPAENVKSDSENASSASQVNGTWDDSDSDDSDDLPLAKISKQTVTTKPTIKEETECIVCKYVSEEKQKERENEELITCSDCKVKGHSTCMGLNDDMLKVIKTYPWQCEECKTCVQCMDAYDEDKMLFCDRCDRGYHTFCVGLESLPTGQWDCFSCRGDTTPFKSLPRPTPKANSENTLEPEATLDGPDLIAEYETSNAGKNKNEAEKKKKPNDEVDSGSSRKKKKVAEETSSAAVSDLSSDSEDDIPLSKTKAGQSKLIETKDKKEPIDPMSDHAYLRRLRQICRECQMFVRNDRELAGCDTVKEKIEKLEQMLRNVGMKGKPTMKKAEEVKLLKEAKELSADNIISSETGRVMRKVKSIWARRTISPAKAPKAATGNPFVGLKDIVDSEGSGSVTDD